MPIEVVGRLLRRGGVYLAGEAVECEVTITNVATHAEHIPPEIPGEKREENELCKTELIQWCSVQIHCQEVVNLRRVKVLKNVRQQQLSQNDVANGSTSFIPTRGEIGSAVYAPNPSILFCDLKLAPNQSKTYQYTETLPGDNVPPSFKGLSLKYLYKLTIGVQHFSSPVKLFRIPFRVLTLPGLAEMCLDNRHLSGSNAVLNGDQHHPSTLDVANELIETITARRSPHTYTVTNDRGKVCSLTLQKKAFKLGEDVVGSFEFTGAASACSQFLVSLQADEQIAEEYLENKDQCALITTVATQHAVCLYYSSCELRLQIPLTVTPTFFNDLVNVRWNLHFEFVITDNLRGNSVRHPDGGVEWTAPEVMDIQTVVWDLPIKIYACNPLHAANASFVVENVAKPFSITI